MPRFLGAGKGPRETRSWPTRCRRNPQHRRQTNEGKAAQEARDATQSDEDAYETASGVEEDAVSETEG